MERRTLRAVERFPQLKAENHFVTSEETWSYNCIAWAVQDSNRWWEPSTSYGCYWPKGAQIGYTVEALVSAYATLGFVIDQESLFDPEADQIAIYGKDGEYKHAARRTGEHSWTSKLGPSFDIEHTLLAIAGGAYGDVVLFLTRHRGAKDVPKP